MNIEFRMAGRKRRRLRYHLDLLSEGICFEDESIRILIHR